MYVIVDLQRVYGNTIIQNRLNISKVTSIEFYNIDKASETVGLICLSSLPE